MRIVRLAVAVFVVGGVCACSSDRQPSPTAPTYTPPAVDCSLVGTLPCQQPPPDLCLDPKASNYGKPEVCIIPPPPVPTPAPEPPPKPTFPPPAPYVPGPFVISPFNWPTSITAAESPTFVVSAIDPVGPVTYAWTFSDDGSTATGYHVSHTFASPGSATVTVIANDTKTTSQLTQTYTVLSPILVVSLTCAPAAHGASTTCAAGASYQSAAATITSVDWSWGDTTSTAGAGAITSHVYGTANTFTAQATVHATTAAGAKTNSASTNVIVP